MAYWLFLDDERFPPSKPVHADLVNLPCIIARSYTEFVDTVLHHGCPVFVTFDHDLGRDKNGKDCANWLVSHLLSDMSRLPENFRYDVHSMNPVGAKNIRSLMDGFMTHCV